MTHAIISAAFAAILVAGLASIIHDMRRPL